MSDYEKLLKEATPLPLEIVNNWNYQTIRSGSGAIIVSNQASDCSEEKDRANAKLLCHSANVLSKALEALKSAVDILEKDFDYRPDDDARFEEIKSAIAEIENVKP